MLHLIILIWFVYCLILWIGALSTPDWRKKYKSDLSDYEPHYQQYKDK